MRRRSRRRGFLTGAFFFSLLGILAGVSAWKFGWLPIDVAGFDAESSAEPNADGAGRDAPSNQPADAAATDLFVMDPQPDPFLESEDGAGDPHAGGAASARPASRRWDDPAMPAIPRRLPSTANAAMTGRLGDSGNRPFIDEPRNGIVQVSNEQIAEPQIPATSPPQLEEIDRLLQAGDTMTAHRDLSKLYWNRPESRPAIQKRIEATARSIYFEPQPHYLEPYVVQPGDQLRLIARKYRVPWEYLAKLNKVDPQRIRAGRRLKVNNGPFSAVVDLGEFALTVHSQGYVVRRYPVGIGKNNSSPIGKFAVTDKMVNPQYTDPEGNVFSPDDPDNPIGERWLAIGDGYGIHGTINPNSVGRAESRGCIRMKHADVVEVYDLLTVGSEVVVRR